MRFEPPLVVSAVVAAVLFCAPAPAGAQEAASVSIGAGFSVTAPTNPAAGSDLAPGVLLRLKSGDGFGPSLGLGWFSSSVQTNVDGRQVKLGDVYVRPLMFGLGYGRYVRAHVQWFASAGAGIAFNHARGTGALKKALEDLGQGAVGVQVEDCFTWRLNGGLWIDLSQSVGMVVSVGYQGVQPEITITSDAGNRRYRMDLGSVVTSIGFTYGIF